MRLVRRRGAGLVLGCVTALATWRVIGEAQACTCDPADEVTWPRDQMVVPQNVRMFVDRLDCEASGEEFRVIAGDQGAVFVPDPNMGTRGPMAVFALEPMPPVGATVLVEACEAECDDSDWVSPDLTFTVSDADDIAPAAPEVGELDYVLVDVEMWGCAQTEPRVEPARDWSFVLSPAFDARDEVRLYNIRVGPVGSADVTVDNVFVEGDASEIAIVVRRFEEDAGHEVCAVVTAYDAAGNASETLRTCRTLGPGETLEEQRGCSCSTGASSPAAPLLLLPVFAMARRRRGLARPRP